MRIENELKLDFKDVLFRPKRSTLGSRSQATVTRQLQFVHSGQQFNGVPIIAANMDTVGTFSMARALEQHHMLVALHKHYDTQQYIDFYNGLRPGGYDVGTIGFKEFNKLTHFFSMGILERDFEKFQAVAAGTELNFPVCIDVANGYTETMVDFIKRFRDLNPNRTIMAGNVVTAEMTEQLILSGADIVKVGIGPGSVCTTRKMTGVGYPQLSAIIECADAAHGLKGQICGDGGCTVPGDIAKAFGGGADFVMLGGMLAGTDEGEGNIVTKLYETNELEEYETWEHTVMEHKTVSDKVTKTGKVVEKKQFVEFYGMSSDTAMNKYAGGVAKYRASEGKTVLIPYKGPVDSVALEILGGLRSTMTYIGASQLKEIPKCTTFVRVSAQLNEVFSKA